MFAGQSDVIIRSDVTSGVHPQNAPWYSGSLYYRNFFNVRRALLLPGNEKVHLVESLGNPTYSLASNWNCEVVA